MQNGENEKFSKFALETVKKCPVDSRGKNIPEPGEVIKSPEYLDNRINKSAGTFLMYRARAGVREYTAGTGVSGSREKANSEKSRCRIQSCSLYCKDVHKGQ